MVTIISRWTCAATCDSGNPCYRPGCPYARQAYCPDLSYNSAFGFPPNYCNPNAQHFWFRWWSTSPPPPPPPPPHPPRRPPPPPPPSPRRRPPPPPPSPPPGPRTYPRPNGPGTVRIGVGNRSNTDIDIDVRDNLVMGGRRRVDIGSGNYAGRSNMGTISNNRADADDLMIGADNYASGDNNIRVRNNDFTGYGRVRIGSGNYAGGGNRIVVDGLGSDSSNAWPQQGRTRWWFF